MNHILNAHNREKIYGEEKRPCEICFSIWCCSFERHVVKLQLDYIYNNTIIHISQIYIHIPRSFPLATFRNSIILGFNVQENKNIFIKPLFYRDKCVLFVLYVFTNCIFVLHAHVLKPFFITCFRFEEILFDIRMSVFKNMRKGQRS